jgi:mannose-6-phosphate isomerase
MDAYPYKFAPIYQERIWGGRNLARVFARTLPEGKPIGESWELADLAQGASVVSNGPLAGKTITELTRELGPALLGAARPMPDGRFPLLLKYLDAEETLSLQVHPDAEAARLLGGDAALKTECWYVLESRGGFLYKGLRPGVTPEQFREALAGDRAADLLMRYEVAASDFHYLPAGTVHALGSGVLAAEIQTPSDTTYRVSDWGRGRQTHVEQAMQCIHFEGAANEPDAEAGSAGAGAGGGPLVSNEWFTVARRRGRGGERFAFPPGVCTAVMVLQGSIELSHAGRAEPAVGLAAGDTALLPASLESARGRAIGDMMLLNIGVGGVR